MPLRYLRMSVTALCNLHCVYCRAGVNGNPTGRADEPPLDDLALLARCAAAEGVRKVRITGGEPLLRPDLPDIVRCVSATPGIEETALTTNGIGLDLVAADLKRAGLRRPNISLDTLRAERFRAITGHDRLAEVVAGVEVAAQTFDTVKLNTVLLRGVNDDEIEALVGFAARLGAEIRFIERYPSLGAADDCPPAVPAAEVEQRLRRAFGAIERLPTPALSVAESYALPSAGGARVGIIASVSHPPCRTCGKLRFTAGGKLRGCLFRPSGCDVLSLLRQEDEDAVRRAMRDVFAAKVRSGHRLDGAATAPVNLMGG